MTITTPLFNMKKTVEEKLKTAIDCYDKDYETDLIVEILQNVDEEYQAETLETIQDLIGTSFIRGFNLAGKIDSKF